MSLPPPVQSILELFQGPLSNMRFADVDAAGLAQLAAEVEGAAAEVEAREAALVELRQNLAQRYEALLALSHQALAYARVYAENNDEQLLETIGQIVLARSNPPRGTKGRKLSAKGEPGAREGGKAATDSSSADAASAAPGDAASAEPANTPPEGEPPVNAADDLAQDAAQDATPVRAPGARKGRPRNAHASAS